MTALQAFLLGLIQGLTEFLPISSSGHLALAGHFFGLDPQREIFFDLVLHMGSLVAVLIYFWREVRELLGAVGAMGRQLARDGQYREAIKILEAVSNKDDPMVLTYLGYSHRKLGDVDLGISLYKKALAIDPENIRTREYLGEGYVSKGQLDLAWLELSEIEKRCGTTCEEYRALHKVMQSTGSLYSN